MARRSAKAGQAREQKFHVRIGTPTQPGETKSYTSLSAAKTRAFDELDKWQAFCFRSNKAGLEPLHAAREQVDRVIDATLQIDKFDLTVEVDSYSGLKVRIEIWKHPK